MSRCILKRCATLVFALAALHGGGQSLFAMQAVQPVQAVQGGGARGQTAPAPPAPRRPDGRVVLGTAPGEAALWFPAGGGGQRFVNVEDAAPVEGTLKMSQVPFQPWARAVYEYRAAYQLEPHTRCKLSGGPRQFLTPYGVEIVEMAEMKQIFIMDLGGPHTYRTIYMDGRGHPKNPVPTYYGHSTGKWEGDTLVIDTVGFNEKFWIDRQGVPHTEKLHMIEKLTRTDYNTIKYEATIDDPGAYTATWTSGFNLRWTPNTDLFEYICQDNNFASELMVGAGEFVDRSSQIIP